MDQQTEKPEKKSDKKPTAKPVEGGVEIVNRHYAGAGFTLAESDMGPRVSFSEKAGQKQAVTPEQAKYLLTKTYRRQQQNGRTTDEPRFARA